MKLEINYTKKTGKFTNVRRLTKCYWTTNGSKKKPKRNQKYFETNKNGNTPNFVGYSKTSFTAKVHGNKSLPQETGLQQTLHLKELEKKTMHKVEGRE